VRGLRVHIPSLEAVFADITGYGDAPPPPDPDSDPESETADDEASAAVAFEEEN